MGKSFFQNTCNPTGLGGKLMVTMMNSGHATMSKWGFSHIDVKDDTHMLDIGCGGGANVAHMLRENETGKVYGIDYSLVSVEKTRRVNKNAITDGRCDVQKANVMDLPFKNGMFDTVTAFETIYFWPDLTEAFSQVHRVLKEDGTFMICNESDGSNAEDERWTKMINGMTIYKPLDLKKHLEKAGFSNIQMETNEKGWLCVVAKH